jgi:hypothetical protein
VFAVLGTKMAREPTFASKLHEVATGGRQTIDDLKQAGRDALKDAPR